jgi:hypothetical protein
MVTKINKRNDHGVKDSMYMYRTVKGVHYIQWAIYATPERVKAYREAGVSVRKFVGEFFIPETDKDKAAAVDLRLGEDKWW